MIRSAFSPWSNPLQKYRCIRRHRVLKFSLLPLLSGAIYYCYFKTVKMWNSKYNPPPSKRLLSKLSHPSPKGLVHSMWFLCFSLVILIVAFGKSLKLSLRSGILTFSKVFERSMAYNNGCLKDFPSLDNHNWTPSNPSIPVLNGLIFALCLF